MKTICTLSDKVKNLILSSNINARRMEGKTMLHGASLEMTIFLLENGADVHARDCDGMTPLFFSRDPKQAERLILAGANVNEKSESGLSVLFCVNTEVMAVLLAKGSFVNVRDKRGRTPLHYANEQATMLLLEHGADPNAKDNDGLPPLFTACCLHYSGPNYAKIRALKAAGADPSQITQHAFNSMEFYEI